MFVLDLMGFIPDFFASLFIFSSLKNQVYIKFKPFFQPKNF